MRRYLRELVSGGALALSATCLVTGCRVFDNIVGLAHVINDDGKDRGNPNGQNPGTQDLTIAAYPASLHVGDSAQLGALYPGVGAGPSVNWVTWSSADSSVADLVPCYNSTCVAAASVGIVTITGTYLASKATLGISVLPNSAGISALLNVGTAPPAWVPSAVKVQAGSSVQFNIGSTHNVTFAVVPGAPPNIATGAAGPDIVRLFSTAGSFAYQCTIHGEAGVVNVFAVP